MITIALLLIPAAKLPAPINPLLGVQPKGARDPSRPWRRAIKRETLFLIRYLLKKYPVFFDNDVYFLFFKTPLQPVAPKANKLKRAVGSGVDTGVDTGVSARKVYAMSPLPTP